MVATLNDYIAEIQVYETQILIMDKNAPMKSDIDKICGIMASSIGMDKFEYIKNICKIMQEQHTSFSEAVDKMRKK